MSKVDWKEANGTVTSASEAGSNRGRTFYSVAFSYKVDDHFYGGTFTTDEEYHEGDQIAVRYNAKDPNRNDLVEKEKHQWWILWGVLAGAALFIVIFIALTRSR